VPTSDPDVQQKARQALQQRIMKLPGWQRPAVVEAHDETLPRTASRKVKRREVKRFLDELLKKREAEAEANGGAADNVVALSPVRQAIARTAGVDVSKVPPSTTRRSARRWLRRTTPTACSAPAPPSANGC
jgi:hypothetical protein